MNSAGKKIKFNKIVSDIKSIKIQGARNIARAALEAYLLIPNKKSKQALLGSRPTEPMMHYVLNLAEKGIPRAKIIEHFEQAQNSINKKTLSLIKNNDVIFTHCHSTNVSHALIYARKKGKKFQVYNTETRPLYQGRKTASELKKAGIKVTMFVDSAIDTALSQDNVAKIFIGADALLKKGIINKIGSNMLAKLASLRKIPLYIIADSWKFSKAKIPIEQRAMNEVWDKAPKGIKIKNPAFEFVQKKYINGIITEFGLMDYDSFVKRMMK